MPDIGAEAAGPSYSVVRLCKALNTLKQETTLALIGNADNTPFIESFSRGFGPQRLGCSPSMRRWLNQEITSCSVDIVHNHSLWMMPNVYPGWETKGTPIPYVVSPRGTLSQWAMRSGSSIKKIFWPLIQKPSIKHAACFHATAYSEYEDIRRMGFSQPVTLIPNGIDLPGFPESFKARADSERTLLFLGRLHPVKGIDHLLGAWRDLQNVFPEWRLRIVGPEGDGEYLRHLKSISAQFGLKRVAFDAPLYGDSKFEAYRAAELYVLPTHSENFGMTVAESLASGTPAVVSQGAPWQGLELKDAGWWPEIGEKSLAAALRNAMALPPDRLRSMGQNGRAWMEEEFAWSGVAKNMLDTYQWLLCRGDKPDHVIID
ncbi:glycosyltransferase [Marinobacter profundi]|nr:glycosyltransferase [Marinobacter profundi]